MQAQGGSACQLSVLACTQSDRRAYLYTLLKGVVLKARVALLLCCLGAGMVHKRFQRVALIQLLGARVPGQGDMEGLLFGRESYRPGGGMLNQHWGATAVCQKDVKGGVGWSVARACSRRVLQTMHKVYKAA